MDTRKKLLLILGFTLNVAAFASSPVYSLPPPCPEVCMSCSPCDEKCYYFGSTTCGGYGVCGDCLGIDDTKGSATFTAK